MKINWALLFFCIPLLSLAQFKKGDVFLQVDVNSIISGVTSQRGQNNSFNIPLSHIGVGKFINPNQALGLQVIFSRNNPENNSGLFPYNYSAGLGVFSLWVKPMGNNWGILLNNTLQARAGRVKYLGKNQPYDGSIYASNFTTEFGFYALFLNKISANLSFNLVQASYKQEKRDGETVNFRQFDLNTQLPNSVSLNSFNLRLSLFLNRKSNALK